MKNSKKKTSNVTRSALRRLIEETLQTEMEGDEFDGGEDVGVSVDAVISKISADCGEDISAMVAPEDKILLVAKIGSMVGFDINILSQIFQKLVEHSESEAGEADDFSDDAEV